MQAHQSSDRRGGRGDPSEVLTRLIRSSDEQRATSGSRKASTTSSCKAKGKRSADVRRTSIGAGGRASGESTRAGLARSAAVSYATRRHARCYGLSTGKVDRSRQGGLNGWEIARRITKKHPLSHHPYDRPRRAQGFRRCSDSVLIPKPYAPAQLVTALSNLLHIGPDRLRTATSVCWRTALQSIGRRSRTGRIRDIRVLTLWCT